MTTAPDPSSSARLMKLVRQHAQASRLMGVDFIPIASGFEPASPVIPSPPASPAPAPAPLPAPATQPRPPVPPAVSAAPEPASIVESKPVELPAPARAPAHADADRVAAQRLLDDIRARYERDAPHQHFVTDHHTIVFGEGDPRARLMFIGEAPGAEEDKTGRPFVGRAGQLLEKMIEAMGLTREQVYIANVLKTRPPNNATPTMDECARCAPYLYEQIAVVRPEVIVTLGLPATRVMLNTMESMGKLRGHWSSFPPPGVLAPAIAPIPVMPTYHPAFLLRAYTRENRQKVWSDLQMVAQRLGLASRAATA